MCDLMTLRQKLMLAYMEDIISINTMVYFVLIYKLSLIENVCKN